MCLSYFQLVANLVVKSGQVQNQSQIAKLKDESKGNEMVAETLPDSVSTFTLMGNLFVSEGKPGKVRSNTCCKITTIFFCNLKAVP